jgi:hypothetical protein
MSDSICRSVVQPIARRLTAAGSGIGSSITYLSRLLTNSTTTPFYSGTTDIVDSSSTGDYREIQPGRCLVGNGSTQYITVGDIAANVRSISFWVKPEDITSHTDGVLRLASGKTVTIVNGTVTLTGISGDIRVNDVDTAVIGGIDQWFYVSIVLSADHDADAVVLMQDGTTELDGGLSVVLFYSDVLTDAEITALYRQGLQPDSVVAGQPDATNLVGRWLLDDNSQTTAYDSSGNGNHGTIVGYASGMLYEGDDVPYSQQNLVGWSERINLMPSTYLFDLGDWSGISVTSGTYEEVTLSNGQPGFRISTNLSRYYRTQQQSIDAGDYTLKMYCENIDPSLTRPMAQAIGSSVYGSLLPGDFVNGWAEKTFTHTGGTLNIRCGLGCNANETGSGSADFTHVTLEAGDTTGQLTPQQCQPGSGFVSSGGIAPRDESDPANDILGNTLDYTGTVPKYATLINAPCLTFDGATQYLHIPDWDWDLSQDWQISFHIIPDLSANTVVVSSFDSVLFGSNYFVIETDGGFELFLGGTSNGVDALRAGWSVAGTFVDGEIHLVLLSWESATNTATLEVNGSTIASGSVTSPTTTQLDGMGILSRRPATLSAGSIWNFKYSLGGWLPLSEGDGNRVYDVVNGNSYTITGYASTMWDITQSQFFYSFENGCRESSGVAIPALADGSAAADGNPLTGLPGLLNSDSYNLNLLPQPDAPYQRSAIPGSTFDGTDYVSAGHLTGSETVESSGGTSTPSVSAGRIDFTAGTCWDLILSDGTRYKFSRNYGLTVPDASGNGNDGTLIVNSSLSQIFAPTALETAYTLGDGRTRPHYVTVDSPNEKEFRTEII